MFSKTGLDNLMKQAQEIQNKMKVVQKEISKIEITGQSGAGAVKVTLLGSHYCKNIEIDPKFITDYNQTMLKDLIVAAFNDAIIKISDFQKQKMSSISPNIPFSN